MARDLYSSAAWSALCSRARSRDGNRCSVGRLLGGTCSPVLHCHHLIPIADGGAPLDLDNVLTVCAVHHPQIEALRRYVLRKRQPRRCRHRHPYAHGREACERRLELV